MVGYDGKKLYFDLPIPPSKNKKMILCRGELKLSYDVKSYYNEIKLIACQLRNKVEEYLFLHSFDKKTKLLYVGITLFQSTQKTDIHNHNEFTCDALQEITSINDLYYVIENKPRLYCPDGEECMNIAIEVLDNPYQKSKEEYKKVMGTKARRK